MMKDKDGFGPDDIREQIDVSRETFERLDRVIATLADWKDRKNLIGPSEWDHLWRRHVWDSLQLWPMIPANAAIIDLGSGGGFPGLPLACALTANGTGHVTMIESVGRKCLFLRDAIANAGLAGSVHQGRIETAPVTNVEIVTARALAPLPKLLDLAAPWLRQGAAGLFHKGESWEEELTAAAAKWTFASQVIPSRSGAGVILRLSEVSDG